MSATAMYHFTIRADDLPAAPAFFFDPDQAKIEIDYGPSAPAPA